MKIEVLYSEVANLFGDMANIRYLEKFNKFKFIYTSLNDKPKFISEKIDLVYLGPMSEHSQELVINALKPFKKEIEKAIEDGVNFLVTGNALEVFGKYILNEDGSRIEGLDIFDLYAKRNMMKRYNSIELGKFKDLKIVGFRSSFTQVYNNDTRFLDMIRGYGNNFEDKVEGVCKNNFIGTSLLGPILIINPYFTKYLLNKIGYNESLLYEDEMIEAYNQRLSEFEDLKRNLD